MQLVYLSPVPWSSFAQRSHKLVEWFHARTGGQVLWIDPYPSRFPELGDFRWNNPASSGGEPAPIWLKHLRPRALPIEPIHGSGIFNGVLWGNIFAAMDAFLAGEDCRIGIGKPSELALQTLARFPDHLSFYDAMDNFPAFYSGFSRRSMERTEAVLASRVGRISVSSTELARRFFIYRSKTKIACNACESDALPAVTNLPRTKDKLVLGFVGTIGRWFDWPLVCAFARQSPSLKIRLIGPVFHPPHEALPRNIELLPACNHPAAIRAMQSFTVGLIPFKQTDLTASVDPIKYYEYRALGLPVLSTKFGEMAHRNNQPGVFLVDKETELKCLIESALAYESEADEIRNFRTANTWEKRFDASGILS